MLQHSTPAPINNTNTNRHYANASRSRSTSTSNNGGSHTAQLAEASSAKAPQVVQLQGQLLRQ